MRPRRPRILVTLDTGETRRRGVPFPLLQAKEAYASAVERAGGTPILTGPTAELEVREDLLDLADAILITGGDFDIDPARFGGARGARLDAPKPARTDFEWSLFLAALERGLPVLGVCGGMQLMNVALGGTLLGDIASEVPDAFEHEQPHSPAEPAHDVTLVPASHLRAILGTGHIPTNTTHHQAVARLGAGLTASAHAPDGVIEAIELSLRVIGVQWHPELLDDAPSRALYAHLVKEARPGRLAAK